MLEEILKEFRISNYYLNKCLQDYVNEPIKDNLLIQRYKNLRLRFYIPEDIQRYYDNLFYKSA